MNSRLKPVINDGLRLYNKCISYGSLKFCPIANNSVGFWFNLTSSHTHSSIAIGILFMSVYVHLMPLYEIIKEKWQFLFLCVKSLSSVWLDKWEGRSPWYAQIGSLWYTERAFEGKLILNVTFQITPLLWMNICTLYMCPCPYEIEIQYITWLVGSAS